MHIDRQKGLCSHNFNRYNFVSIVAHSIMWACRSLPHLHLDWHNSGQLSLALQGFQVALHFVHLMLALHQSFLQCLTVQFAVHDDLLHLLEPPI